jgi:parallel beta-helix repeat protein
MKLSHLPAAFYGVSSSKPSTLAYNNYQRRCFRRRIPIPSASASASASALTLISTSTSTSISTKGRNELQHGRCFQSSLSPLASHNRRGFHHRYCYHQYRNLDHNLFPIHSADEDNVNTNPHRISQQRRGICLSGTANNSIHNNTANADTNDPGDASATTTATTTRNFGAATHRGNNAEPSEKRSKYPRVPKLRLFYNDVYEVKLPPNHRFPMGKYRKVREKVQNKIAKLPQETRDSVDCGEWNRMRLIKRTKK